MKKIWMLGLIFPVVALAGPTPKKESTKAPRNVKAHVHGSGKIGIAFQHTDARMEIEVPQQSLLGFENDPKDEKETEALQSVLSTFDKEILEMVKFDPSWKCEVEVSEVNITGDKNHKDLKAVYDMDCPEIKKGTMEFNLQTKFPKWESVEVQIISEKNQLQKTIKKAGTKLELK